MKIKYFVSKSELLSYSNTKMWVNQSTLKKGNTLMFTKGKTFLISSNNQ